MPSADATLRDALWPAAAAARALFEVARRVGLPTEPIEHEPDAPAMSAEAWDAYLQAAAARAGIQAEQVFVALDEIESLARGSGPALVRLSGIEGQPFLAVLGRNARGVRTLGPDLRLHTIPAALIAAVIRQPFEAPHSASVERVLDQMALTGHARARARTAMLDDRLRAARFRGCWLVRLPPGASARQHLRESRLAPRLALLVGAHLGQYGLFIGSWWVLGRAVLQGTSDRGWLAGWLLLLASLIPLRLLATWSQGQAATSIGAWLRRRLLRGALRIDRQEIRRQGAGQLFGLVMEAAAIDGLALTGGVAAALAVLELGVASAILWTGNSTLAAPLLLAWTVLTVTLAWRYFGARRRWTVTRVGITEQLVESMVGHRTRLVQESSTRQHDAEDDLLDRYLEQSGRMDHAAHWLTTLAPRGWMAIAVLALVPGLAAGASTTAIAVSVGGVLLAYRSLQRLTAGLSALMGAAIAAQTVAPLARAAARQEPAGSAAAATLPAGTTGSDTLPVLTARDLLFRYRTQGEAVLRGCELVIAHGARVLLEGPSGSGKTTLASIVAGLEAPESGLLLVDGLDRSVLGAGGWRRRVAMAPQAHDNYIVGGSLAFNLLMGKTWPPDRRDLDEAERVCRELGLGDLIDRLPAGLHQIVGETGWQLSQGERVRVFLARALLQRPELLVLDESFSALDAENVDRAVRCVMTRADSVLAIAHP